MAKFQPKVFPDILQRMINRVVARTALSDLTDTSTFKTILAACAREIDDAYFQTANQLDVFSIERASGDDLDRRAEDYNPASVSRRLAIASSGSLEFGRTTPNPGPDIPIPLGSEIEVPGENPPIVATTTVAGSILTGLTTSGNVAAIVSRVGARGNVAPNQFTKFRSAKPSGVDTVTNLSSFVGGLDKESDDSFRQRIKDFVASLSRCTPLALETAVLAVEVPTTGQKVVFSRAIENLVNLGFVTLYVDDGAGTAESTAAVGAEILTAGTEFPGNVAQGGEVFLQTDNKAIKDLVTPSLIKSPGAVTLIRDDAGANGYTLNAASGQIRLNTALAVGDAVVAGYTHFTGLIALAQKVIDGDVADRVNFPGNRAAGVLVQVIAPTVVAITVTATVAIRDGFNQTTVTNEVRDEIAAYVNALGIGRDVIIAEIIERSMSVPGMFDMAVSTPVANVVVLDDQLPRVNNAATDITLS